MINQFKVFLVFFLIFGNFTVTQAQDKVFYSSFRPQGWDIYLSTDYGENFSKFTQHESLDYDAKITPDGKWVVFTSERNGPPQLYIKGAHIDSVPRLLVHSKSMQDQVDFSPDGKWMVFVSTHGGNADIYKLPFSPTDTLRIEDAVNLTNDKGGDFRPKFSHDGKNIAFSSDRSHPTVPLLPRLVFAMQRTGDIYVMNADGGETQRLTESKNWEGSPIWSKDDQELIYYSANRKDESYKLHKMSRTGKNSEQISPGNYSCMSPVLKSDGQILFTSFIKETKGFSIQGLNTQTQEIDSSLVQDMDMFNVDYHNSGIVLYHGGAKPKEEPINKNGFDGDLLVKNSPQLVEIIPNKSLSLFGVRRAFSAPPTLQGDKIIYDYSSVNSFQEAITPYIYPLILLPILALVWLVVGVYRSIKKRKTIAFWKHLIFSIVAIASIAFVGIQTDSKMFLEVLPMSEVKQFLLISTCIFLVLGFMAYLIFRKRREVQKSIASLYKLYSVMFIIYAALVLYSYVFISSFFHTGKEFYTADYSNNEISHLFDFVPDADFNPQFANIIDTKITPDGQYLQFSVGGFRRSPNAVGSIYRYHLEDKSLERMTDLDSNNGFADFSQDNKVMVFRSGRTGNMDIYVQENDEITNITNSPDKETFPVISYDGNKIAYCSDVNGIDKDGVVKTMDIFMVERTANGWSEPTQLTTYSGQEGHGHFSPDGEWLIYTTEEFGINDEQPLIQPYIFSPQMYGEITAIRLSDGAKFRLTHNKWEDGAPLWQKGN